MVGGISGIVAGKVARLLAGRRVRDIEYSVLEEGLTVSNDPGAVIRGRLQRFFSSDDYDDRIYKVYTRGNRYVGQTSGMTPVRIGRGRYGWLNEMGELIRSDDISNALYSVDAALGEYDNPQLRNAYDAATPKQKVLIARDLQDFDWDVFWKESYDPNTGEFYSGSETEIVETLMKHIPEFTFFSEDMDESLMFENPERYI